jgi:cellulose synthase/poly-beta-1,6-N-acetylglucosamine synthase-like glycosyltransferase
MLIQILVLAFSLVVTLSFFIYGFNQYYLIRLARKYEAPLPPPDAPIDRPRVAIHLPIYNEQYVVRRLVAACARMAEVYERRSVHIVVIDDSDDDTTIEVDSVVRDWQAEHLEIEVLRRGSRQGFKAGALQAALERTEEEFIAIFDADFLPPADFLIRSLPYMLKEPQLGIIQSRWTHINGDYNRLTNAIALGIDVHFLIEQTGRYAAGCFQNFNGSGGILRTKALLAAGGWQSDTLAEDLDASYRIQLLGYRVLYLKDLLSPGEVPPTVPSFKKQQGRWACGSLRTAKKLLPDLLAKRDLGLKRRFQAFVHLTGYMVHPLMATSFVLACVATLLRVDAFRLPPVFIHSPFSAGTYTLKTLAVLAPQYLIWLPMALLIVLCAVAAWIPPLVALRAQALPASRKPSSFLILFLLGCGVSLSNTIEAGKALLTDRNWAFQRTPKYAIDRGQRDWRQKRYQVPLDFVCILELCFMGLGAVSSGYALSRSDFGVLLILIPFTAAYAFVSTLTILQSRGEART